MRNYQSLSPTTGIIIKEFPEISDAQVQDGITKAHNRYTSDWRLRTVAERALIIGKAAELMRDQAEELAGYVTLEMGKLIGQSLSEVELSASILEYYAVHATSLLATRPILSSSGSSSVITLEPIGVLMAIEPWNFPYYQLARVAGPQLVVGNVVLVKHARNVPQCALAFARILVEAGAPEGVYTNLFVSFQQIEGIIGDDRVRGVTLTGSEKAGAAVASLAGQHLTKVVLELGGSDPFIVLPDAPLHSAIALGAEGRLRVMGQECTSSKRFIIIGRARGELFIAGLVTAFNSLKVGSPADSETTLGPLSSKQALEDLLKQVEEAAKGGAKVVCGGKKVDRHGFYMEPTIITSISPSNPLYQAEAFGPVASVYVVETEDEAIALANATRFGLGSSIFSSDVGHARKLAERIESGMVFINSSAYFAPELPFGGVKNSGFGRETGELGVGEFINYKLIRVA